MSKICSYGDAFRIAYVVPTGREVDEVNIFHSGGGVLLLEQILTELFDVSLIDLRTVPNREGHELDGPPPRLSYYLKRAADGQLLMVEGTTRPALLRIAHFRPGPGYPTKVDSPPLCTVYFERASRSSDELRKQDLPTTCHHLVRYISPIVYPFSSGGFDVGRHRIKVEGGACAIVSAQQMASQTRVRLQSSYEAMVVDLLSWWRWDEPEKRENFRRAFGETTDSPDPLWECGKPRYIVCRLPAGAMLIYGGVWGGVDGKENPGAWLVFDRSRPAALGEIGGSVAKGTGMFVAACIVRALTECSTSAFGETLLRAVWQAIAVTNQYFKEGVECVQYFPGSIEERWAALTTSTAWEASPRAVEFLKGDAAKGVKDAQTWYDLLRSKAWKDLQECPRWPEILAGEKWAAMPKWSGLRVAAARVSLESTPLEEIATLPLVLPQVYSREKLWSMARRNLYEAYEDGSPALKKLVDEEWSGANPTKSLPTVWPTEYALYSGAATLFLSPQQGGGIGEEVAIKQSEALWKKLPVVKIGGLHLIDREEIEDYLAIQNILVNYVHSKPDKPLNLAVFGPPGAGKSFGTSELLANLGGESNSFQKKPVEFNLSQFRSVRDLAEALHVVRNEGLKERIPVAFFDEFDSAFEGRSYGWLQFLLAPMQDGQFWDNNQSFHLGKCVLVFAGGVNRRFSEINGRLRDPSFCAAKGPDFISRLRGVLNVRGVNKPEEEQDQSRYLLRRATLLRGMLARLHQKAGAPSPPILMDRPTARAFMRTDGFRHGNRSMEQILRMSHWQPGRTLSASDLPPLEQLNVHVDGKHFLDLLKLP